MNRRLGKAVGILLFWITSSHAADIGTVAVNDEHFSKVTYELVDGLALAEGDIVIGRADEIDNPSAIVVRKVKGKRWPNGIIPFDIDEALPLSNKIAVYRAIDTWQQQTHIEFVELTSKNREHYPDYIHFRPVEGTTCSSHVGKHGGMQTINLSPRCTHMTTVHEIGHALGLWHEQSRADRKHYIQIVWDNIKPEHLHNFNQHLSDGKDLGEYDYGSIMHYSEYAFSKNGERTIVPLQEGAKIGQREHLSAKDIAAVDLMYPNA